MTRIVGDSPHPVKARSILIVFLSGNPTKPKGIGKERIVFNGRVDVLYGPNGLGKTTILRTVAALTGCGEG